MKIEKAEGGLISDTDLFSTVDGRVVDGDDPEANALIARAGLPIPPEAAESLGIKETGHHHAKAKEENEAEPHAPKKAKG